MKFDSIATGSSGNFSIVGGCIGIDCGVPWRVIRPYAKQLKLMLLTHRHIDHFKPSTAKALALCRPGLRWGCCSWMLPSITEIVPLRQVDALECGTVYDYGAFTVKPERVPHNVPNCGYHIQIGRERCFYATDLSSIEHVQAKGYDLLAIEGNHHRDEIEERIRAKRAAGEYAYEIEAMRNHLSIEQAMDWISTMSDSHTEYVLLHGHVDR